LNSRRRRRVPPCPAAADCHSFPCSPFGTKCTRATCPKTAALRIVTSAACCDFIGPAPPPPSGAQWCLGEGGGTTVRPVGRQPCGYTGWWCGLVCGTGSSEDDSEPCGTLLRWRYFYGDNGFLSVICRGGRCLHPCQWLTQVRGRGNTAFPHQCVLRLIFMSEFSTPRIV